jgi:hypothetical protein
MKVLSSLIILFFFTTFAFGQKVDTTKTITTFSGAVGVTNNGFSIIPTFSLNSPAVLIWPSWQKKRWSFDPDIRLALDARKGSMVFWLRYKLVNSPKFKLRWGIHPAFNLQIREIITNGVSSEITQMRRFIANEIVPSYQIKKNWSVGIYYLQGNGLQKDGPVTSHFVNLNTSITNIKLGSKLKLHLTPAVYYLFLDGYTGTYFTGNVTLRHNKYPISLQGAINQTIQSNIPNNRAYLWSISMHYHWKKDMVSVK